MASDLSRKEEIEYPSRDLDEKHSGSRPRYRTSVSICISKLIFCPLISPSGHCSVWIFAWEFSSLNASIRPEICMSSSKYERLHYADMLLLSNTWS